MRKALRFAAPLMLAAPLLMAAGAPATAAVAVECGTACTRDYNPVECQFSDGTTQTFSNECMARAYACEQGLTIVSCRGSGSDEPPS